MALAAEAGRRWPLMRTDDLVGALWLPRDGRTNPIDTTLALAKGVPVADTENMTNGNSAPLFMLGHGLTY